MQTFETLITVNKNDLDELNHVNNIRYVEWVQEIAKQHWLKKASQDTLENFFWVMTNHCIEYKNEAFLNDNIKLDVSSGFGISKAAPNWYFSLGCNKSCFYCQQIDLLMN